MSTSLTHIFEKLGLNKSNGLYITPENEWRNLFSKRIEEFIESEYCPNAFFVLNKKPFILFYDNPKNEIEIFKAVWCFNESPIIILNKNDVVGIYNGFSYIRKELVA